jgi:hypothetical protein
VIEGCDPRSAPRAQDSEGGRGCSGRMVPGLFARVESVALGRADASMSAIEMLARQADPQFVVGAGRRIERGPPRHGFPG